MTVETHLLQGVVQSCYVPAQTRPGGSCRERASARQADRKVERLLLPVQECKWQQMKPVASCCRQLGFLIPGPAYTRYAA